MSVFRYDVNPDNTGVNLKYAPKAASTEIDENTFVSLDAAGRIVPADKDSDFILGVSVTRVTDADANYADTARIGYDEPREGERFIVDVDDASTVGFVKGVERALVDEGTVKAAVPGDDTATVVIQEVLVDQDKAVVTIKSLTNKS